MPKSWPFDQTPSTAAITTRRVIFDGFPILVVTHYLDDHSWAFLCGTTNTTEDGRIFSMQEALNLDPSIKSIANLSPGWTARRDAVGADWIKSRDENN